MTDGQLERDFMKALECEHTVGTKFSQKILKQFNDLYYGGRQYNEGRLYDENRTYSYPGPTTDDEKYQACTEYKHSMFFQHYIVNSELKNATENNTITYEYKVEIVVILDRITQFQESVYSSIQYAWIHHDPYLHSIYNGDVTTPLPETNIDIFQVIRFLVECGYYWGWGDSCCHELSYPPYACHNDNDYDIWSCAYDDDDIDPYIKTYDGCFKQDWIELTKMYAMTAYTHWFSDEVPTIFHKNHTLIRSEDHARIQKR
jgi:hypothetical protein